MTDYRLSATDLLTGRRLVHALPATIDSITERLNAPMSIAATVSLDASKQRLWDALEPRRTAIWLWDGSELVGGGILWQDDVDVDARTVRYGVAGHTSYLDRREIRDTLIFQAADPVMIAQRLIDYAQGTPDSAIGLQYLAPTTPGTLYDRVYDGGELKPVGEAVRQLGSQADGFDHRERYLVDGDGRPYCQVEFGSPYLADVNRRVLFVYDDTPGAPSNVLNYRWPRDGSGSGNNALLPGAGEGSARARGTYVGTDELAEGVPRLDWSTTQHQDITDSQTLAALAREYVRVLKGCRVVPSMTVGPDGPPLAAYRVGDVCRFRLTSVIHPATEAGLPGREVWLRITGRTVTPADKGQGLSVELQLEGKPWELS